MKMKRFLLSVVCLMVLFAFGCFPKNATNTSTTNVGVTSYETTGVILTQAFNIEKGLLKSGKITAAQDKDFQLNIYAKAVAGYKAVGAAAVAALSATDSEKETALEKFNALSAQLPALISAVTNFIQEVK